MFSHRRTFAAMATAFEFVLVGDDAEHLEAVAAAAEDEVGRLEAMLSRFDPASEIARANRDAAVRPVKLSAEAFDLLAACERYRDRTGGAFDVAAGAPAFELNADSRTIQFPHSSTRLDLGGVGKGYALDRVAELVRTFRVPHALLNAGTSSVVAIGSRPDGKPWPIDLRDPADDSRPPLTRVPLADLALSCSAAVHSGQSTSDIREPRSGEPIRGAAGCVVLAGTATDAEVLSTALLVMGRDAATWYLEREPWPGVAAGWLDDGRCEWLTDP